MTYQNRPPKPEAPALSWNTQRALGTYALTVRRFQEAQAALTAADEAIRTINEGLPTGYKVGTKSSAMSERRPNGTGGYSTIYRPDDSGAYAPVGELCTLGAEKPFLGHRILQTAENGLIIINDELQLGLSVNAEVFVVDTANDPLKKTLGGSCTKQFEELLPLVQDVPFGDRVAYDLSYY